MNKINHIAFIMDGNGRWATKHGLVRTQGHLEGAKRISEVILACIEQEIPIASFFAFSTENWNRPKTEVSFLIKLLKKYLNKKSLKWFKEHDVKINLISVETKDKKIQKLLDEIQNFCNQTSSHQTITVNICFNYGSEQEILLAIKKLINSKQAINIQNFKSHLLIPQDVDLLIRTSGENRISNFLLFQISYSEIIFEPTLWPDYKKEIFTKNILEFNHRVRRFGKV